MPSVLDTGLRVVTRAFQGDGLRRLPGELVDVAPWPNAAALERARYLDRLPADATPVVVEDGRTFMSAQAAVEAGYDVNVTPSDDEV